MTTLTASRQGSDVKADPVFGQQHHLIATIGVPFLVLNRIRWAAPWRADAAPPPAKR
jgi:hypothetical protein